jgi:4-hydroxy-tetrahydrodipicolinate synthase
MNETIVALVTPFLKEKQIDFGSFENLLNIHLVQLTKAILILGSTGEGALLNFEEKKELIKKTSLVLKDKKPFIVAISSPSTMESVALCQVAKKWGACGVLCTLPFYIKTTPNGLITHFKQIQDVGLELILYENPTRVGHSFSIELLEKLSQFKNIKGIKASTNDFSWIEQVKQTPLKIYCGDDIYLYTMAQLGVSANISVIANLVPDLVAKAGSMQQFQQLKPLIDAIFQEPNPVGIKYALSYLQMCMPYVRPPLLDATASNQERIKQVLDHLFAQKKLF